MNKAITAFIILSLFCLAGCDDNQQVIARAQNNLQDTVSASDSKSADRIEVTAGEEFVIILDENEATGYQWALLNQVDKNIVKFVSAKYETTSDSQTGTGGKSVWTFKAINKGSVPVSLKYFRPWEKKLPPIKKQTFYISVKNDTSTSKLNLSAFFNKGK